MPVAAAADCGTSLVGAVEPSSNNTAVMRGFVAMVPSDGGWLMDLRGVDASGVTDCLLDELELRLRDDGFVWLTS